MSVPHDPRNTLKYSEVFADCECFFLNNSLKYFDYRNVTDIVTPNVVVKNNVKVVSVDLFSTKFFHNLSSSSIKLSAVGLVD